MNTSSIWMALCYMVTFGNFFVAAADGKRQSLDFGDFVAFLIILLLLFGGICSFLGRYARMRAQEM